MIGMTGNPAGQHEIISVDQNTRNGLRSFGPLLRPSAGNASSDLTTIRIEKRHRIPRTKLTRHSNHPHVKEAGLSRRQRLCGP